VRNKIKAEAKLKLAISTAIIDNRHAMFTVLMHTDRRRLDVKLAEFLLEQAGWPIEQFMSSYMMGELDG
jgi:hypothetical protein